MKRKFSDYIFNYLKELATFRQEHFLLGTVYQIKNAHLWAMESSNEYFGIQRFLQVNLGQLDR